MSDQKDSGPVGFPEGEAFGWSGSRLWCGLEIVKSWEKNQGWEFLVEILVIAQICECPLGRGR